jgi:hypothetical protein
MEQMIVCALAVVALCWWVGVAPWSVPVAVQRQAGAGRSRM